MVELSIETQVDGLGTIIVHDDRGFAESSKAVLSICDQFISFRDLAYARIKKGELNSVSKKGSFVREAAVYIPKSTNRRIWLREFPLIVQHASEIEKAYQNGHNALVPPDFNIHQYLEQNVTNEELFILKDLSNIPTNRFGDDPRTVWAFQDQAKEYGLFLQNLVKGQRVEEVEFTAWTDRRYGGDNNLDAHERAFANQMTLGPLYRHSYIGAAHQQIGYRVRGIARTSRENAD